MESFTSQELGGLLELLTPRPSTLRAFRGLEKLGKALEEAEKWLGSEQWEGKLKCEENKPYL